MSLDYGVVKARFDAAFIPEPNTGCWLWNAATQSRGKREYGVFDMGPLRKMRAHVASHLMHKGGIPLGDFVLHACDTPLCVNPDHLSTGSHADNMADARKRGRFNGINAGEKHGGSKLTAVQVRDIRSRRASGETRTALSMAYGVSRSTISSITSGQRWRHV